MFSENDLTELWVDNKVQRTSYHNIQFDGSKHINLNTDNQAPSTRCLKRLASRKNGKMCRVPKEDTREAFR